VISLRYHVVTIVAVFLALAVGMLVGSAILQPRLVDELRNRTEHAVRDADALRAEVGKLRSDIADLNGFTDASLPWLTEGRLTSTRVVVIAQEGVPDDVVGEAQRALASAGATVVATLTATAKLGSADPADGRQLAEILGRPEASSEDLSRIAITAIAERLAAPQRRLPASSDLLHDLLSAGYLTPLGSLVTDATLEQVGGTSEAVVVLAGGQSAQAPMSPAAFAVPLTAALARLRVPVAAGQSRTSVERFVEALRQDGGDGMVTVDDLDASIGGAALVLGLQQLIAEGRGGAYGVGDGALLLPTPS
jgi:hypothetical protein